MLHNDKTDCVLGCVSGKLSHSLHIKIKPWCDFNYGEFIYVDILYLNVVGIGGFKYWLTIIEHKSHHPLCLSLKLKNDTVDDIIVAVTKLEQQCDTHMKIIQCDGAGEFIGKHRKLSKFCKEKGIHLQWFACSEHKQNTITERYNRTSQEGIRSNLHSGRCPDFFWPEAAEFFDLCYQSTVHGDAKISPLQYGCLLHVGPNCEEIFRVC